MKTLKKSSSKLKISTSKQSEKLNESAGRGFYKENLGLQEQL